MTTTIENQFQQCTKDKIFEIEVINKLSNEVDYLIFHISTCESKFIAQHEATCEAEKLSNKIAFVSVDIDDDFSLDENLQGLYEKCISKIIDSEYFDILDNN